MKKIFITNSFKLLVLGLTCLLIFSTCTLEEEVYSEIISDGFGTTEEELAGIVGAAYASYGGYIGNVWNFTETSSDEAINPTRGTDWAEGGQWCRLHTHEFRPDDFYAGGLWNTLYSGINNVNRIIFQLESNTSELAIQTIKELRVLRAFNYYVLMDSYGNIPLVTRFDGDPSPPTTPRAAVYDFVKTEVEEVINDLPTDRATTYGKVNKWVAHALLAKLYLNAEVWSGTPQWNSVIQNTDAIINSGQFSLAGNFFDNFSVDNENSPETIWALVYDEVFSGGMQIAVRTLHYNSQTTYSFTAQPWNGICSLQEFYDSFSDDDVRKNSFIVGQQFDPAGNPILDAQFEQPNPSDPNALFDPDGAPLNFTPSVTACGGAGALRQDGARIGKWEFVQGANPGSMNNDFQIFRYGDILLTKAEAAFRTGDTDMALALINTIRDRAGVAPFTTLDEDMILAERGREMAFEIYRRQDLIRFGKFNEPWAHKPQDPSDHVNVFPVSTGNLNANANLQQNPGY